MGKRRNYKKNVAQNTVATSNFDIDKFAKSNSWQKPIGSKGSVSLTKEQVNNYLKDPIKNYDQIGKVIQTLVNSSGNLSNILNYYSSLLTYNYNIFPSLEKSDSSYDLEDYLSVGKEVELYNIRLFVPYFVRKTLINGMSFFYEIKNSDGLAYLEFPLSMCKISSVDNGVYRWMINVSKIPKEVANSPTFPTELKKAMEEKGEKNPNRWADKDWYYVSDKGVAFCFDMSVLQNGGVAVSKLASLIPEAIQVIGAKKNVDIKDGIDSIRLIHGQMMLNKESKPSLTLEEASKWRAALESGAPNGVSVAVTPFELSNVSLNGSGSGGAYDTVSDAQKQLFSAMGMPAQFFGGDTKSGNILETLIKRDISWMYAFVNPVFDNYYSYTLSKFKTSGASWKLRLLKQSIFTRSDDLQLYKDSIALGGSRTDYLAAMGMSPLEIYGKLTMEQRMLDIDSLMIPKQMSYTMASSGSGRPTTDSPTEDTERLRDR